MRGWSIGLIVALSLAGCTGGDPAEPGPPAPAMHDVWDLDLPTVDGSGSYTDFLFNGGAQAWRLTVSDTFFAGGFTNFDGDDWMAALLPAVRPAPADNCMVANGAYGFSLGTWGNAARAGIPAGDYILVLAGGSSGEQFEINDGPSAATASAGAQVDDYVEWAVASSTQPPDYVLVDMQTDVTIDQPAGLLELSTFLSRAGIGGPFDPRNYVQAGEGTLALASPCGDDSFDVGLLPDPFNLPWLVTSHWTGGGEIQVTASFDRLIDSGALALGAAWMGFPTVEGKTPTGPQ